jgi:glutamate racemase
VNFIDPAPAIARRVAHLLGPASSPGAAPCAGGTRAIFTSGRAPHAVLAGFGVRAEEPAPTSVR